MGKLIDSASLFERRRKLAPIMPQLLDHALRHAPYAEPTYSNLKEALHKAILHPRFPDVLLDEGDLRVFKELIKAIDGWEHPRMRAAYRYALFHMRRCLGKDPFQLPSLATFLDQYPEDMEFLLVGVGILAIAWQIKKGGTLVLSREDFFNTYPELAKKLLPRQD